MCHVTGEVLSFECQRPATLAGRRFRAGQSVTVTLRAPWHEERGQGQGGPWGWGGYTSRTLRAIAREIHDAGNGARIY